MEEETVTEISKGYENTTDNQHQQPSTETTESVKTSEILVEKISETRVENKTVTNLTKKENKKSDKVPEVNLQTIHKIYRSDVEQTEIESDEIIITRNNSTRSKLNKAVYAKLHRKSSSNNSNPTHIDILKGKYENIAKQTDNVIDKTTTANTNSDIPNKKINESVGNVEIFQEETRVSSDFDTLESEGKQTTNFSNKECDSSICITNTTEHIEKLQKNLSGKLSQETVEILKTKYSPASFGYPKIFTSKIPKKVQFSPETSPVASSETSSAISPTTKIPVPKPRISVKPKEDAVVTDAQITIQPIKVTVVSPEKPERVYTTTSTIASTFGDNSKPDTNFDVVDSTIIEKSILPVDTYDFAEIVFAEPEEKYFIARRSSSEDSVTKVKSFFDDITMEKKQKLKKRSNSFRKMLSGSFFGSNKKKNDGDKKQNKKNENAVFSDNAQNESNAFLRNSVQRHTIDGNYPCKEFQNKGQTNNTTENYYQNVSRSNGNVKEDLNSQIERKFSEMHINHFKQIKENFSAPHQSTSYPSEDYVCMNQTQSSESTKPTYMNVPKVKRYIDTSSSSSTSESDKQFDALARSTVRSPQQIEHARNHSEILLANAPKPPVPNCNNSVNNYTHSPERFSETPPRASETYQNLQLVKPKALIPINSERPLPNPYHNDDQTSPAKKLNESNIFKPNQPHFEETYGTVFDSIEYNRRNISPANQNVNRHRSLSPQYRASPIPPRSPSLESTKLKLPPNRERVELQPRIKSPIPQTKVSTDKIIATELLKNARSPTPTMKNTRTSPSHQRLELEIDYPDNVNNGMNHSATKTKPPLSPKKPNVDQILEAAEWQKKQKEIDNFPFVPVQNSQQRITTSAIVHKSPTKTDYDLNERYYPGVTPPQVSPRAASYQDRSSTPVNQKIMQTSHQLSPEKQEMRQNVEAFYWNEVKKMKEQKKREEEMYYYQLLSSTYGFAEDPIFSRRSRSVSPSTQRNGRRSLSLPRDIRPQKPLRQIPESAYVSLRHPETIPEDRIIANNQILYRVVSPITSDPNYRQLNSQTNPHFIRNSPQRRTFNSRNDYENYYYANQEVGQRPIFKRGSLTHQPVSEQIYQTNKKVSFPGPQNAGNQQMWPTKNGFTQSPPQRRIDKRDSLLEDDVFLPNSPKPINMQPSENRKPRREIVITNDSPYGYSSGNFQRFPAHEQRNLAPNHISEQVDSVKMESPYGTVRHRNYYPQNFMSQNSLYSSKQNIADSLQGKPPLMKQVTVTNKVCDMYGQIHDSNSPTYGQIQQTGVLYGQLQKNPNPGSPVVHRQNVSNCFVRGSRLTSSANDMYRKYQMVDPRYRSDSVVFEPIYEQRYLVAPNRSLPPIPNERSSSLLKKNRFFQASDTESETSEVQRIMRNDGHYKLRKANALISLYVLLLLVNNFLKIFRILN